jgi:tetratricopeptide (TPR) repeat protein
MSGDGSERGGVARIVDVALLEHLAGEEGQTYGPLLLAEPPSRWRGMMRGDPHYRSFGTLRFLLHDAHEKIECQPSIAREITSAVLLFVDEAKGPSRIHEIGLRGLARKEHANVLEYTGDLRVALKYAERAIAIYEEVPSLHFDQTKARLVACHIHRDLGHTGKALEIARECAGIFRDYADSAYRVMARMSEGIVLFARKDFAEALALFTDLAEEAEREGDKLTLARALQNGAECARELEDLKAARNLYPRALALFEELERPTEAARVRWGSALALAADGVIYTATSELYKVRAVYLQLGANVSAATAGLDLVRVSFDAGHDVRELASELVVTLTEAGLTQYAVEALAYVREEAKAGSLTSKKITAVRTYFGELARSPTLLFLRPAESEEGQ